MLCRSETWCLGEVEMAILERAWREITTICVTKLDEKKSS